MYADKGIRTHWFIRIMLPLSPSPIVSPSPLFSYLPFSPISLSQFLYLLRWFGKTEICKLNNYIFVVIIALIFWEPVPFWFEYMWNHNNLLLAVCGVICELAHKKHIKDSSIYQH